MDGQGAILELKGVRKTYRNDLIKGKQLALDGVSCRFEQGACTGLLGHNGAGKTTTIRLILGLARPDSGEVLFEGRRLTTADKRFIGYMPEVNKLPGGLTPSEILHHQLALTAPAGLETRAARDQAVEAKLVEAGLAGHRKKQIARLSKGMARRLAWAQATIHKPRLLILDEPASGLDPLGRRRLLGWIEAEKRRGTSILLCTHELAQVSALCDGFHVLRRGKLVMTSQKDLPQARQRYALHVSGLDEGTLGRFAESERLPPIVAARHEGFLAALSFIEYEDAARWLAALLGKGYVVVRFGDEVSLGEDELLQFFEGES